MTLAELAPAAHQLSYSEKIKLIRLLVEDLEQVDRTILLDPTTTYDLPTPYDSFGAGEILMTAFNKK